MDERGKQKRGGRDREQEGRKKAVGEGTECRLLPAAQPIKMWMREYGCGLGIVEEM